MVTHTNLCASQELRVAAWDARLDHPGGTYEGQARAPRTAGHADDSGSGERSATGGRLGLDIPSPTRPGPQGANTLSRLCHHLRLGCTPHGMRSSFWTWCGETEQPRELAEQALAHVNPNGVEAAYMRSDLFERRWELMEAWSDYLVNRLDG